MFILRRRRKHACLGMEGAGLLDPKIKLLTCSLSVANSLTDSTTLMRQFLALTARLLPLLSVNGFTWNGKAAITLHFGMKQKCFMYPLHIYKLSKLQ